MSAARWSRRSARTWGRSGSLGRRSIPFLPAFILPYLSIDLFFVGAPFLCADRAELGTHARRITLAVVTAGAFFLLMPLTLAVTRPRADGWMGDFFAAFCAVDQPFNLFPSLHIALGVLLVEIYGRHTRGALRWAVQVWFILVGVSTLFTWQHHIVDVLGGFALAVGCIWFVRPSPPAPAVTPHARIGAYYALLALLALLVGTLFPTPWGVVMAWPFFALAVTSLAYFGAGPGIFRKANGRLRWVSRIVLAPVLFGQWLSLRHYRRQSRPWDRVAPGVWVGRVLDEPEAMQAVREGVTAVIDLTGEFDEARPLRARRYLHLPILDLTAPTPAQLDEAVAFLRGEKACGGTTYIHCKIGYSRSAAVAGAWLLASERAGDADDALRRLRAARPGIVIRPEAEAVIRAYAARFEKEPAIASALEA